MIRMIQTKAGILFQEEGSFMFILSVEKQRMVVNSQAIYVPNHDLMAFLQGAFQSILIFREPFPSQRS